MKFFKRSSSPRPAASSSRKLADKKTVDVADVGPLDLSGGSSSGRVSAGSGGSWERWRPAVVDRMTFSTRRESDRVTSQSRRNLFEVKPHSSAGTAVEPELSGDRPQRLPVPAAAEPTEASGPDDVGSATSNGSSGASLSAVSNQLQRRRYQRRSRGPRRRRVLASVSIVKGTDGFGFTVITARHGQKVNSIIEEDRCVGLRRGDLLLSINGADLAGLQHDDIVNLLRQCPEGAAAELIVRRRDYLTPNGTVDKAMNEHDRTREAANGYREQSFKNGGWTASQLAGMAGGAEATEDVPPLPARHHHPATTVDELLDATACSHILTERTSSSTSQWSRTSAAAGTAAVGAGPSAVTARIDRPVSAAAHNNSNATAALSLKADRPNGMWQSHDDSSAFLNGREPHRAALASLPPRQPVEPLWRWQQWYQQQQSEQQKQQQQHRQTEQHRKPARLPLAEGIRVTTLDDLQQRYFQQWKQDSMNIRNGARQHVAAAIEANGVGRCAEPVTVIGAGTASDAPPPLPPRPWKRTQSLATLQKQQSRQQPEPQQQRLHASPWTDRATEVSPSAAANSAKNTAVMVAPWEATSATGRASGSANLLQPPAIDRLSRKEQQQHHPKQGASSQPAAVLRSSSVSPVRSASAARAQDDSQRGDSRSRNLHLLRNRVLSAPSLPQSAAIVAQAGGGDGVLVPHFATLGRRPAKPDRLRVGQTVAGNANSGSSSNSSSNHVAARQAVKYVVHAPSAAATIAAETLNRRSGRSRTPDGTFWGRLQYDTKLRNSEETERDLVAGRGADDDVQTRPASSSASASQRRRGGISMGTAAAAAAVTGTPSRAESMRPQSEPVDDGLRSSDAGIASEKSSTSRQQRVAAIDSVDTSCSPRVQRHSMPLPPPSPAEAGSTEPQIPARPNTNAAAEVLAATVTAAGRPELTQQQQQPIAVGRYQHVEMDVSIYRKESGFGFCVVGGPEGGTQVTVGRIAPGGAADVEGSLRTGDEILAVDGVPTLGASHYRVIQLMGGAASRGQVDLRVRRRLLIQAQHPARADGSEDHVDVQHTSRPLPAAASQHPLYPTAQHRQLSSAIGASAFATTTSYPPPPWAAVSSPVYVGAPDDHHRLAVTISSCSITLTQQVGDEGFGIVIVTPRQQQHDSLAEVKIGQIHPNSPAARCGRLFVGDRILSINGVPVSGLAHDAVVALIKERGRTVSIAVAAGEPATASSPPAAAVSRETGERLPSNRFDLATGSEHHHHSRTQASFDAAASTGDELSRQDSFLEVSAVPCVGQSCPDTPVLSAAGRTGRLHSDLGPSGFAAICDDDGDNRVPFSPAYGGSEQDRGSFGAPQHRDGAKLFLPSSAVRNDGIRAAAGSINVAAPSWPSSTMPLRFGGSYCQLDSVDAAIAANHSVLPRDDFQSQLRSSASMKGPLARNTTLPPLPSSQSVAAAAVSALPSSAVSAQQQQQPNVFTVDLTQDGKGFGFSVRGGHEFGAAPLCVLRLAPGGAAERSGKLQVGDEILAINGRRTAGVRHADAIGLIQDAGRAVRLTVQRSGSSVEAASVALPHHGRPAIDEAAEVGDGGSPRSSPTGSSANGSNGGVNGEKWWSSVGQQQQPQAAAAAASARLGQTPVGGDRTRSETDLAAVDDWGAKLAPKSSATGGGLLMQAPLWRPSHNTLPAFSGQQQQQRLAESPPLSAGEKFRGSRTSGSTAVSAVSIGVDGVQRPRSLCTSVPAVTSGYLSPGTTGSLRVVAELDVSHMSGRYSVAEATASGRGVPVATAPFGFYETLLRQTSP